MRDFSMHVAATLVGTLDAAALVYLAGVLTSRIRPDLLLVYPAMLFLAISLMVLTVTLVPRRFDGETSRDPVARDS
jgi:hypothetical protein